MAYAIWIWCPKIEGKRALHVCRDLQARKGNRCPVKCEYKIKSKAKRRG